MCNRKGKRIINHYIRIRSLSSRIQDSIYIAFESTKNSGKKDNKSHPDQMKTPDSLHPPYSAFFDAFVLTFISA